MRIGLPLYAIVLVPSDVHEVVGEDGRHLCDKCIEKLVGTFARRIHHRIEDAELPLNVKGTGSTREIGIADEPGTAMSGHVELRHDTDAAITRIANNLAGLLLGIEKSVGA